MKVFQDTAGLGIRGGILRKARVSFTSFKVKISSALEAALAGAHCDLPEWHPSKPGCSSCMHEMASLSQDKRGDLEITWMDRSA